MGITRKDTGKVVSGKSEIIGIAGSPNGTSVTAIESAGVVHQTVINLSGTTLTGVDNTDMQFAQKAYDFPEGSILILGATADFTIVGSGGVATSGTGYWSAGTGTCATMVGTDVNIIPKSSQFTLSSYTAALTGGNVAIINSGAPFDGTSTASDLYVNFLIDAGSFTTTGVLTVTGTVTVTWCSFGDY